jgi:hypothetical protein
MAKPSGKDLINEENFFKFVRDGQRYNTPNGIRSTAAANGNQQWAATTHTVADILQGNLGGVNPQDQLLVINKGLTDSLKVLYDSPENIHGYSTFTNTVPNVTGGSGAGDYGGGEIGRTVEESWVLTLPTRHPEGPLIWQGNGKASKEMHLPTSANLQEDIARHIQYPDMSPEDKHPWNMDRVGGAVGGQNRIYYSVSEATSRLNENPNLPGTTGAFGYLDPISEQFYCLPGYVKVYTSHGPIEIRDIKPETLVYSYNELSDQIELAPVSLQKKMGVKKTLRIKTFNYSLDLSEGHKVAILSRDGTRKTRKELKLSWVKASELIEGDVIIGAHGIGNFESGHEPAPEIAFMAGLMLADGSVNRMVKKETADTYGGGSQFFKVCIPRGRQRDKILDVLSGLGWTHSFEDNRCCIYFNTIDIQEWIYDYIINTSPNRALPKWIWTASKEIQKKFLDGYMYGDGSYAICEGATQLSCEISCSSKTLAEDLNVLCHYIGFRTSNVRKQASDSGYKQGAILYGFVFYEENSRKQIPSSYTRNNIDLNPNLVCRTIRSIETLEEQEVWDISVEGNNNFFADGILVHNCSMAWPYSPGSAIEDFAKAGRPDMVTAARGLKKNQYFGKKILVFNKANKRAVVCTPGDWGTRPQWSNGSVPRSSLLGFYIGLSYDVHHALGSDHGVDVLIRWMPDDTPLGPYGTPIAGASGAGGGASKIIAWAETQLGAPYATINPWRMGTPPWPGGSKIGITGRRYNFPKGTIVYDCSGFVVAAYRQVGVDFPRDFGISTSQGFLDNRLPSVTREQLRPGDIVVYNRRNGIGHVVLVHHVDAQGTVHTIESAGGGGVVKRTVTWDRVNGMKRPVLPQAASSGPLPRGVV